MAFDKEAYFKALEQMMEKFDRHLGELKTPIHAYVCGGSAMMYWLDQARITLDVDAFFSHPFNPPPNTKVFFSDRHGNAYDLDFDYGFNQNFSLLHPDYSAEANPILEFPNLRVFVLSPLDLAVMKSSRYNERDRHDIKLLIKAGLLSDESQFRFRAEEALIYYAGNYTFIKITIDEICEMIQHIH